MPVSLRQLEYFITVVDEGSFTGAAELLGVSQPGLSHQIQTLEQELGGPLLERLPRKVRLTPAGRTALPHARASLAHAQRASSAARRASGVETGELHVGTLYSISTGVLPGALRTWRRSYPELQVHLVEFPHTNELIAAMEAGQADVAVGPTPPGWDGPCRISQLTLIAGVNPRRAPAAPRARRVARLRPDPERHQVPAELDAVHGGSRELRQKRVNGV
jgi:DNA-binding transcriptional LysR family regulator